VSKELAPKPEPTVLFGLLCVVRSFTACDIGIATCGSPSPGIRSVILAASVVIGAEIRSWCSDCSSCRGHFPDLRRGFRRRGIRCPRCRADHVSHRSHRVVLLRIQGG